MKAASVEELRLMILKRFESNVQEIYAALQKTDIGIVVHGSAESGKSTLIKSLFQMSQAELKVFQGGVPFDYRGRVLSDINYEINKYFSHSDAILFIDEFDDVDSLKQIESLVKNSGLRAVITTKLNTLSGLFGGVMTFEIDNSWIRDVILNSSNLTTSLRFAIDNFELGGVLTLLSDYAETRAIKNEDLLDMRKVYDQKTYVKDTARNSACLIETPKERTLKCYTFK